jgi:hypothetical protein
MLGTRTYKHIGGIHRTHADTYTHRWRWCMYVCIHTKASVYTGGDTHEGQVSGGDSALRGGCMYVYTQKQVFTQVETRITVKPLVETVPCVGGVCMYTHKNKCLHRWTHASRSSLWWRQCPVWGVSPSASLRSVLAPDCNYAHAW